MSFLEHLRWVFTFQRPSQESLDKFFERTKGKQAYWNPWGWLPFAPDIIYR